MKLLVNLFICSLFFSISEARLSSDIGNSTMIANMSGVTISTDDSTNCIPAKLKGFINELIAQFGRVEVNSAYRSSSHNRRVGGARRSQHMNCNAIDFSVPGVSRSDVKLFLTANFRGRAGVGFYCNNRFHLDVGSSRQWGGCQPSSRDIAAAQRRYPRDVLALLQRPTHQTIRAPAYQQDSDDDATVLQ